MNYGRFGSTEMKVSVLGLGAVAGAAFLGADP